MPSKEDTTASHNRSKKIKRLFLVFTLAFVSFFPILAFLFFSPRVLWSFPFGVMFLVSRLGYTPYLSLAEQGIDGLLSIIWLCVLGISTAIVTSTSKWLVRSLFVVLILFLLLDLVGWYTQVLSHIT